MSTWLVLTVPGKLQHGGIDNYRDIHGEQYTWDDTSPNARHIKVGDVILLWDKKSLLGASVIETIDVKKNDTKVRFVCPKCDGRIKARTRVTPEWRCQNTECGHEFSSNDRKQITTYVDTRTAFYAPAWTDLSGTLTGNQLRSIAPGQNAIRKISSQELLDLFSHTDLPFPSELFAQTAKRVIAAGHTLSTVRARIGQAAFRSDLVKKYGSICAITGPTPLPALEAAHLYSYANHGQHHEDGGLLLRRDIHGLFDRGLIRINPDTFNIVVDSSLAEFPAYVALEGQQPHIQLSRNQRQWLHLHWETHKNTTYRPGVTS
ncbi:HNH endonuclease [Glutamicibacter nicotianae]|uniref:HNH endonuclease n=1 Tax=Glutamicibacter nicotianae TaxID=37929 RepID=UPI0019580F4C|nr:HNH endonuclease [Glutamicibacter nicotianae]MBM7769793.1 ribosomal protein L37AE/L43A [Glutamicibacter nicotianae]